MKCLVTTARFLLLVDLETSQVTPLDGSQTDWYGVSWFPGDADLVLGQSGIDNNSVSSFEDMARSEQGYLAHGSRRTGRFLASPHQLTCASDGRVICSNTGRNCITVVDLNRPGQVQEARLSEGRWDKWDPGTDSGDHINSVFEQGDRLYVIAHRFRKGSVLAEFSYPELELVSARPIGTLSGVHNVWIGADGEALTCASHEGGLANAHDGSIVWSSGHNVYTRGLAVSDEMIVVGESAYTERVHRNFSISGLWLVDRQTMRSLDYIYLGPFGGVHDVRLIDVADHAHHGHVFGGAGKLIAASPMNALRSEKLRRSERSRRLSSFWNGYRNVLGGISVDQDGWLSAEDGRVCLIVPLDGREPDVLEFEFDMTAGTAAPHVSVVLGYAGGHADMEMTALLLQRSNSEAATLWLWHGKDGAWVHDPEPLAGGLPMSGTIRVGEVPGGVAMSVAGADPIVIAADVIGRPFAPMGIRWSNTRIRPSTLAVD